MFDSTARSPRRGRCLAHLVATAIAAACVLIPAAREANASACCGDASGLGDRLSEGEIVAFTARMSMRGRFGSFDGEGRFTGASAGSLDLRFEPSIDAAVRLAPRLELGATASGVLNVRAAGDESAVGGGVGDVRARARATLFSSTTDTLWPGLSVTTGAVIPVGVPASASTAPLYSDVTGQGDAEVGLGLTIDKVYASSLLVRVDGYVGFFMPSSIDATPAQRAPRLVASVALGPVFDGYALAFGITHEAESAPSTAPFGTTARTRTDASAMALVDISWGLTFLASLRSPLPIDGFGAHETAGVTTTLGIRTAMFEP